ncbi:MAG: EamA family transporter [Desulfobulbus propionicus]|nr:MAG: EamA family transporter [Desulfobulbus propionicus]
MNNTAKTSLANPTTNRDSLVGAFFIVLAACMWGFIGPLSKIALKEGVAPLEIAFWRAALSTLIFGIHSGVQHRCKISTNSIVPLLGFGLISVTVFYASYQLAIESVGVAVAVILLYTSPVWVALLSWAVLKERVSVHRWIATAITIAGAVCICFPDTTAGIALSPLGIIAGLMSGFSYGLYYIYGKKLLVALPSSTVFFYALLCGTIFLFPLVSFSSKSLAAWLAILGLAALSTYFALLAYSEGVKRLDASKAVIIATLEPVVGVVVACYFFDETLTMQGWIGATLIVGAVMYTGCKD